MAERLPLVSRASTVRLTLGSAGVLIAQSPYWFGTARISGFVVVLALLALVPYLAYFAAVRTPTGSFVGGLALLAMPTIAYADFFFDREPGANFAPATIPFVNIMVLAAVLLLERYVRRRAGGHGE
jgi:hypothetical protein